MMDLGATICTARNPLCALCPLSDDCAGRSDPAAFPVKPAKKARPERQGYVWWMQNGPDVWLVRRPGKGLLGGMRALRSEEHTSELQSLMRISYAVFCLKKKIHNRNMVMIKSKTCTVKQ